MAEHSVVGALRSGYKLGGDAFALVDLNLFPNNDYVAGVEDSLLDSGIFQVATVGSLFVVENFQEYRYKHSMHGKVVLGVLLIANTTQMIVEDHQPLFSVHHDKPRG